LSFWPAALTLTAKIDPAAKDAAPLTVSVERREHAGAISPALGDRPPIPEPPRVALDSTMALDTIEPVTRERSGLTSVTCA
jgi:hypothetical protein